jgi:hypothetical protein
MLLLKEEVQSSAAAGQKNRAKLVQCDKDRMMSELVYGQRTLRGRTVKVA